MNIKLKKLVLPKYVYLLVTNDKYEFAISCCYTIAQMSKETGIPYQALYSSYYRNDTCCSGRYKLHKVDISEPEYLFTFEDYKLFCELHNLKPNKFDNLRKFKLVCGLYN